METYHAGFAITFRRLALRALIPFALALLATPCLAQSADPGSKQGRKRLSYEQVQGFRGRMLFRVSAPSVRWTADRRRVIYGPRGAQRVYDPRTREDKAATGEDLRGSARGGARDAGQGRRRRRGREPMSRIRIDGAKLAFDSPDKKHVAFVRGYNLWIRENATKKEWQVTQDGSPDVYNGELDWVYQEELYGRGNYRGHWWSPDSTKVAFLRLVEKDVPTFPIANTAAPVRRTRGARRRPGAGRRGAAGRGAAGRGGPGASAAGPNNNDARSPGGMSRIARVNNMRYPKAGQANPVVTLHIVDRVLGKVHAVDLSGTPEDRLIVRVGWHNERCLFMVQDRIQTWLNLYAFDPSTGKRQLLVREEAKDGWADRLPFPRWLKDGGFIWESHRTGDRHLYRYSKDGKLRNAITSGNWAVGSIVRLDEMRNELWCSGSAEDNGIDNHYYRATLDGTVQVQLTEKPAAHRLDFGANGEFAIDRWSSIESPGGVELIDGQGKTVKDFGKSKLTGTEGYTLGTWKRLHIKARDGYMIDAALLSPANWKSGKKFPIWLPTYSGPHAPSVRGSFSANAWYHFLAQEGFMVLQVNVRSANPLGRMKYVKACYKQLGVQELRDLEDAVAHVCSQYGGDPDRVGITGWSYGGTMAAFALTHSKAFALGVAGAGVYDWSLYDTIYTERYMSTPQLNPKGYAASSCIEAAKDLHGHLVLLHGTEDDNVHFQNCMMFVYALQQAGKDFELMIFPNAMHGVGGRQGEMRSRITWRAMQKHLLGRK